MNKAKGSVATVYLIGGTGNNLFQMYHGYKTANKIRLNKFFCLRFVRSLLKHKNHPFVLNDLLSEPAIRVFPNLLFLLDLFLYVITRKTMFTDIDLRGAKSKPVFSTKFCLGYFQDYLSFDHDVLERMRHILKKPVIVESDKADNVVHVRGGDFLGKENDTFGVLSDAYYHGITTTLHGAPARVVTDDSRYAQAMLDRIVANEWYIKRAGVLDDFWLMMESKRLYTSNSTFALWAALLSAEKGERFIPSPYTKDGRKFTHAKFEYVNADFK